MMSNVNVFPRRVLLIFNPAAGTLKQRNAMYGIVSLFAKNGCIPSAFSTTQQGDAVRFAKEHAKNHDVVVCCGGDGTLNETITGIMQSGLSVPIGYIPCDSTNDMARTLKLPIGNMRSAAKALFSASPKMQDIGLFRDANDAASDARYFSYVASFGAFTKVSYSVPRIAKNLFGHLVYIFGGVASLGDIKPWRMKVSCAELEAEGDFLFGAISNATFLAGVLKLNEKHVSLDDGKFEVLLIRQPKSAKDLPTIVSALGKLSQDASLSPKDTESILFFRTSDISITPEKEMPWTIDGEYAGYPARAHIRNLRGSIQLYR